jgi:DNA-binding CsgD family transcriptional regulator
MTRDAARPGDVDPVDRSFLAFVHALAVTPDADAVLRFAVDVLLRPHRASSAVLCLDSGDGLSLRTVAQVGVEPVSARHYVCVPLDAPLPLTRVYASGAERISRVVDDLPEFPLLAPWAAANQLPDTTEVASLPVISRGRTIGVLMVVFPDGVDGTWRLRALLDGLADALAIWAAGLHDAHPQPDPPEQALTRLRVTTRQRTVLRAVREGRTNTEIAETLGVSVGTIKNDLADLFRLLGVHDRTHLAVRATQAGLLPERRRQR